MSIGWRRWFPYLIALALLAGAGFLAGNLLADRPAANAQAAPALQPDGGGLCTIENVATYLHRFHVRCKPNTGGIGGTIVYYARSMDSTADSRNADRMLALLTASWAMNKPVFIGWDDDGSHNPSGCVAADCRTLLSVAVVQ
jgi:hypothetical protein